MNISAVSTSFATTSTTAKLSEQEKEYDYDSDGTLSVTEEAAFEAAKAAKTVSDQAEKKQTAEVTRKPQSITDTVEISNEARELLRAKQDLGK
jgi:hypothetical protein